jgi:translation initiation factor eIF-2B subunit delta
MENGTESTTRPPAAAPTVSAPESNTPSTGAVTVTQPGQQTQQLSSSNSGNSSAKQAKSSQPKNDSQQGQGQGQEGGVGKEKTQLTPAEMKKKAKEEKAARREKAKELKQAALGGAAHAGSGPSGSGDTSSLVTGSKRGQQQGGGKEGSLGQRGGQRPGLGPGRRGSMAVGGLTSGAAAADLKVHSAVLALGLQIRDYVICGSSARCVATLLAFKRVSCTVFHC